MVLVSEDNTELMPENQTAEAFKTLSQAKQELADVLRKVQSQTTENEAAEKRLAESQKNEQDLLASEMGEGEQIGKLSQIASLQRLLGAKTEQARSRIEGLEAALRQQIDETHRAFGRALSALLKARQTEHLARLNSMLETEQRVWAEATALAFIQHFSDVRLLNGLGHQTATLLRSGAPRKVAESLLMDITKLEGERQKGR
jgi:hypothetical protein